MNIEHAKFRLVWQENIKVFNFLKKKKKKLLCFHSIFVYMIAFSQLWAFFSSHFLINESWQVIYSTLSANRINKRKQIAIIAISISESSPQSKMYSNLLCTISTGNYVGGLVSIFLV